MAITIKNPFNKKKYELKVATNPNAMIMNALDKGAIKPSQLQSIINMTTRMQLNNYVKKMKKEGKTITAPELVTELRKSMGEEGIALWYKIGNTDESLEEMAEGILK